MHAFGEVAKGLLGLLTIPLMLLNTFGGIVAGIWLMVLGRWGDFGFGIGILLCGSTLIGLVLTPGFVVGATGAVMVEHRRVAPGACLILANNAWTYLVMGFWCLSVFAYLMNRPGGGHPIPYLLWAYANATGPWTYMASMDSRGNEGSASFVAVFAVQLGCAAMMLGLLFMSAVPTFAGLTPFLAPFLLLGIILQTLFVVEVAREMSSGFRVEAVANTFS
jgi:hypothetical protein